ncbi:hypothetical protein COY17_03385 [Candidatus Saccharibacteria bacterium CG_4_10_14_0_2_um_filter_52_9]|nr:MAG: hypothetical protein COY17_03385 [Candidatus Saccharibacteria bacterium CG_4_10_14_0_2_um_filter_52_9]
MPEALQVPQLAPDDIAGNHNILTDEFTSRYIKRAHISLLAKAQRYDPDNPFCGYDQTFWPAMPNEHSELAAKVILGGFFRMLPKKMDRLFYQPFAERVDEIADSLHENPLLVVTGHSPDLVAAIPVHGISKAVAKNQPGDYLQNLYDIIKESHAVGTRGFVPLRFRLPPPIKPENKFLVRAAQLVFGVHFTFPRAETMRESGISLEFIDEYNARARADCLTAVQQPSRHPDGLKQV